MWYQEREEGIVLLVKVIPRSQKNKIVGISGGFLKIKIKAPPEKGKANEKLCQFLAKVFSIPQSDIKIIKGRNRPLKIVFMPTTIDKLKKVVSDCQIVRCGWPR